MKDKKKAPSPLFWNLKPAAQALLMQYQWDTYGKKLDLPPKPKEPESHWSAPEMESLEEIDEIMSQKPHPEGSGWRG